MAKNPNTTRADNGQIQKRIFDPENDALRVVHANDIETSFSLSHKDDSVVAKAECRTLEAGHLHTCSDLQKVQAYGNGTLTLFNDLGEQIELGVFSGQVLEICAITLSSTVTLVGR